MVTVAVLLGGCGSTPGANDSSVVSEELAAHCGQVCPQQLPIGNDPGGHGFGVENDADEVPSLLGPEQAWVCRYDPIEAGPGGNGGTAFEWVRAARARELDESTIPRLETALNHVRPFKDERVCTAGPRAAVDDRLQPQR